MPKRAVYLGFLYTRPDNMIFYPVVWAHSAFSSSVSVMRINSLSGRLGVGVQRDVDRVVVCEAGVFVVEVIAGMETCCVAPGVVVDVDGVVVEATTDVCHAKRSLKEDNF